ncbi:MAG: cytochrome-c peroxidase [Bacteroidota bacterium]
MKTNTLLLLALVLVAFSSCVRDQATVEIRYYSDEEVAILSESLNLPVTPYDYTQAAQSAVPGVRPLTVGFGPVNNAKATLGRVLFYDKNLSANNAVSCASCHDQAKAFADPVAFSEGFEGKATLRNSFALGAVASFSSTYDDPGGNNGGALFWDNRATTVAEQTSLTLQDPIEMGMDLAALPA